MADEHVRRCRAPPVARQRGPKPRDTASHASAQPQQQRRKAKPGWRGRAETDTKMLLRRGQEGSTARPLWQTLWRVPEKLHADAPHDPAVPRAGTRQRDNAQPLAACTWTSRRHRHGSREPGTTPAYPADVKQTNVMWCVERTEFSRKTQRGREAGYAVDGPPKWDTK